ncbi:MAG: DUF4149 domain-containing protein [Nitrospirales bacterium]|nr:DUF4149 domain-containing protein [Nitrospirales bacterium]
MTVQKGKWAWLIDLIELFALGIWIGGLIMIMSAVIPAVFNSMGMEPAGHFLRRVFDGYNIIVGSIVVLLLLTSGFRLWFGAIESNDVFSIGRVEIGLLIGMILMTGLIVGLLGPKAIYLQEQAFAAEQGPLRKAAYDAFFRLHMIVRALHMMNWVLAVVLFVVKIKRWIGKPFATC